MRCGFAPSRYSHHWLFTVEIVPCEVMMKSFLLTSYSVRVVLFAPVLAIFVFVFLKYKQ